MGPQAARRPTTKPRGSRSLLFISAPPQLELALFTSRLLAGALARGIGNYLQIFCHHRRRADLLLEVLLRNPFETRLADYERLRIHVRVINRDGHFQSVMIHAGVAFRYPHIDAVRMPRLVQPAPVVTPDRIHDEAIISIPVSYRVSIPPGIWCVGGSPAHILGKFM